jgi:hypothetical protein
MTAEAHPHAVWEGRSMAGYLLNRHRMVLHKINGNLHSDNLARIEKRTVFFGPHARENARHILKDGATLCRRCFPDGILT